ncbi:MFS transporter [Actinomarinicola tropica]|uniref:MFS transporter n=1 Tax=Actinomarinicola tropica TaxID=2789776 RepID=UPI00189B87CF|nr:MFS transporter [Actinomarinicola tropica]
MRTRRAAVPAVVWIGFAAFIGLGLPEATLGVTWPSIRSEMDRPLSALGLLLGSLTVGYLPASVLSGRIVSRVGAGRMLAGASAVYVASLSLYLFGPTFPFLVLGSLLGGVAAGAIDPGINAHFAVHHGTRAMNLLHASFGIGATGGPFIATVVLDAGGSWRIPYAVYLLVQAGLLLAFLVTRDDWMARPQEDDVDVVSTTADGQLRHGLASPVVVLSVLSFFVYTGLEVGAGVLAFSLLTEGRGMEDRAAGLWATSFWAGVTAGRALLGVVGRDLRAETVMTGGIVGALVSTALIWVDPGGAGAVGFPLLGLSLAGVFPSLVLLTPRRVGAARTADVVGLQFSVAAIGASGLPAAIGVLAEADLERVGPSLLALAVVLAVLDGTLRRISRPAAARPRGGG